MKTPTFTSVFARDVERFIEFKRSMGCYGASRIDYLRSFDKYCTEHQACVLDQETVIGWVEEKRAAQPGSPPSWMSYVRDFGRWMRAHSHPEAYVLSEQWRAGFHRSQPYLLSQSEIVAFFAAAEQLNTSTPWQWQATAFFGLMYSCGLRTCEVQRLGVDDVDLEGKLLNILWSKGNRSRRIPFDDQICQILASSSQKTKSSLGTRRQAFFTASTGAPLGNAAVGVMFNRIWDQAGLPRIQGGPRPRPYAFRHHFAYANIERWMTQSQDVNAMLPYLSRYMGHASSDSTFYYVHTSPDFLKNYAQLSQPYQSLFPEVGFE